MKVRDVMTKSVRTCGPDTKITDIARTMLEEDCGAIPITENNKPVGIITDRDIVIRAVAEGRNPLELKARDCMTAHVATVGADADLNECTDIMEREQVRRIPVVDANGSVVGIVAQADVATKASSAETAELVKDVSQP